MKKILRAALGHMAICEETAQLGMSDVFFDDAKKRSGSRYAVTSNTIQLRPSAFRVFQYSVVLPNFPTESIKQSKAQIERPQSAREASCHIPIVTQTGSALWLALAGSHHRVTAFTQNLVSHHGCIR
jgi:hypothetical protein